MNTRTKGARLVGGGLVMAVVMWQLGLIWFGGAIVIIHGVRLLASATPRTLPHYAVPYPPPSGQPVPPPPYGAPPAPAYGTPYAPAPYGPPSFGASAPSGQIPAPYAPPKDPARPWEG